MLRIQLSKIGTIDSKKDKFNVTENINRNLFYTTLLNDSCKKLNVQLRVERKRRGDDQQAHHSHDEKNEISLKITDPTDNIQLVLKYFPTSIINMIHIAARDLSEHFQKEQASVNNQYL